MRRQWAYFLVGMLAYSLLNLFQCLVLPVVWLRWPLRNLRTRCVRWVAIVTRHARQVWFYSNTQPDTLDRLHAVRARIPVLA